MQVRRTARCGLPAVNYPLVGIPGEHLGKDDAFKISFSVLFIIGIYSVCSAHTLTLCEYCNGCFTMMMCDIQSICTCLYG